MQAFGIALSGIRAAGTMLGATANNIANADTPGYKAARVDMLELSGGGVAARVRQPAGIPDTGSAPPSNVDMARESINLTRAKILYNANAAVVRMADRMTGTLLDITDTPQRRHGVGGSRT